MEDVLLVALRNFIMWLKFLCLRENLIIDLGFDHFIQTQKFDLDLSSMEIFNEDSIVFAIYR